jgi:hypothetical protein
MTPKRQEMSLLGGHLRRHLQETSITHLEENTEIIGTGKINYK